MPGLSRLQRAILEVLPERNNLDRVCPVRGTLERKLFTTGDVIDALGLDKANASTRACVSRAINRLCIRGLVLSWYPQLMRQGKGYLYTRA
jgi:hypothetical protein